MIVWRPEFAAGILMRAESTGRFLLVRESETGTWVTPGGHIEAGEDSEDAAVREFREETGWTLKSYRLCQQTHLSGGYRTFFGSCTREFRPRLSHEHDAHIWADREHLPRGVHPALRSLLCA